ncbi:MAG: Ig-like domain-containing protein, partial [Nitrospirae bacterium]|nr:Ig-like domain-containing protein [Nitrospirota bacterium]
MKRTASLCVVVAVFGLLLGACGGGDGGDNPPATTYLAVSSTSPAQGATGLLTNTDVSVTFSEALDCATVSSATYTIHSGPTGTGAGIAGTLGCTASTITFSPTGTGLSYSTVYLAQVTTGVKSAAGRALASPVAWSFTVKPPTVSVAAGYSH